MKSILIILLWLFCSGLSAQDQWKNIYSQSAWAERDKWQKADELMGLMKIARGDRVADIGCHEGYMTFKMARQVGNDGMVYAVDIEQQKLDKVKKRAEEAGIVQVRTIKGNPNDPKLPAHELSSVIILDTYHEMDEQETVLAGVKASLKKGGRLLICEPIADERRAMSRQEQQRKHELAMEFALADLKKAGFRIIFQKDNFIDRIKEKGDRMWVIVAEKI